LKIGTSLENHEKHDGVLAQVKLQRSKF